MAESEEKGRKNPKQRSHVEVKEKDEDKAKIQMAPVKSDPVLELLGKIIADTGPNPTVDQGSKPLSGKDSLPGPQMQGIKRKEGAKAKHVNGTSGSDDIPELDEWHRALDIAASSQVAGQPATTLGEQPTHLVRRVSALEAELLRRTDPEIDAALLQVIKLENKDLLGSGKETGGVDEEEEAIGTDRGSQFSAALSAESSFEEEYRRRARCGEVLRFVDELLSASVKSQHCLQVFRSAGAVRQEIKRQRRTNRFIIHPFSEFRIGWDIVIVIALIITMIALPVEIAFYSLEKYDFVDDETNITVPFEKHYGPVYEQLNEAAEVLFVIDIVINFRTGFVVAETEEVILTNKEIIWDYLTTWFSFDFLSAFPIDKVYTWITKNTTESKEHSANKTKNSKSGSKEDKDLLRIRFLRMAKVLALLRAFKVLRLLRYIRHLEVIFILPEQYVEMANVVGVTLLFIHWNGCLQYMACFTENYPHFPPETWIAKEKLHLANATVTRRYTRSLMRAMSHMLAMGYCQSPPVTSLETWIVIVSMLFGCMFYMLLVAYLAMVLATLDFTGLQFDHEVDSLLEFSHFHKLPIDLQARLQHFFRHKYRGKFFDSEIFESTAMLPPSLKQALAMHRCRRLVANINIFNNASTELIYKIVSRLELQVFFPGEYIVRAGK